MYRATDDVVGAPRRPQELDLEGRTTAPVDLEQSARWFVTQDEPREAADDAAAPFQAFARADEPAPDPRNAESASDATARWYDAPPDAEAARSVDGLDGGELTPPPFAAPPFAEFDDDAARLRRGAFQKDTTVPRRRRGRGTSASLF